jgi:hypothetical protein
LTEGNRPPLCQISRDRQELVLPQPHSVDQESTFFRGFATPNQTTASTQPAPSTP